MDIAAHIHKSFHSNYSHGLIRAILNDAFTLMIATGLQNIPVGLAVSISSLNAGLGGRLYASLVGIRAGLVEIPSAVLGAWAVVTMKAPIICLSGR